MITDKHFADWESDCFGYGYGTGESFIIPSLCTFMKHVPIDGCYDYLKLQIVCGSAEAWFLINILCHQDMIEYGSSPRFAWLTSKGKALKEYLDCKGEVAAQEVIRDQESWDYCYPDACNCDTPCDNPLWR